MSAQDPKPIDLDMNELDALLERLKKSTVDQKDYQLLEKLVASFAYLTGLIQDKDTTIARLRRAFGSKSEKSNVVLKEKEAEEVAPGAAGTPEADAATTGEPPATKAGAQPAEATDEKEEEKRPGHGRNGAEDYPDAKWTEVSHQTLKSGDPCPKKGCNGKVYRLKEPGVIVRLRALT